LGCCQCMASPRLQRSHSINEVTTDPEAAKPANAGEVTTDSGAQITAREPTASTVSPIAS
jgi:hypothetical protein